MTNGEKIITILKPRKDQIRTYGNWVEIEIQKLGITITCGLDWWSAEYKEPNKSENLTGSIAEYDLEFGQNFLSSVIDWNSCHTSRQLNSISTTKNDLAVDCISRKAALGACHNFAIGILDDYYEKCLKQWITDLPPVTPIMPKGYWIKEKSIHGWDGHSYQCSVCGRSIHLDATVEDLADYPYCHCGAEMERKAKE